MYRVIVRGFFSRFLGVYVFTSVGGFGSRGFDRVTRIIYNRTMERRTIIHTTDVGPDLNENLGVQGQLPGRTYGKRVERVVCLLFTLGVVTSGTGSITRVGGDSRGTPTYLDFGRGPYKIFPITSARQVRLGFEYFDYTLQTSL